MLRIRHALIAGLVALLSSPVRGQTVSPDAKAAIVVADSALAAISRGDFIGLTDLMVDEGVAFSVRERDGQVRYNSLTRAQERARRADAAVNERGFRPVVHVSGRMAVVWMPYDLYLNGQWSHCGVDAFTMLRLDVGWRIAAMAWSVEQPPACERHPAGPPTP
jgi:hypothetical protein